MIKTHTIFRRFGNQQCDKDSVQWCRPRNITCGPLGEQILFAYPTNFTANFEKNLLWLSELKTFDNVKSVIVWNVSFRLQLPPAGSKLQVQTIRFSVEQSVLEVIKNCNTYVALIDMKYSAEVKHKLNLIEQAYLDKMDKCKRAINMRAKNLVFRWRKLLVFKAVLELSLLLLFACFFT